MSAPNCENLWVEVFLYKNKSSIFGTIYRHPSYNISNFNDFFQETVYKLNQSKKSYYICGDFNIDFSKNTNLSYFNDMLSLGCQQLITSLTRISPNKTSNSILDHLYTNRTEKEIVSKVITYELTDHLPIIVWINVSLKKETQPNNMSIRDMKVFDESKFLSFLRRELKNIHCIDGNIYFNMFTERLMKGINSFAPLRRLSRRENKLKTKPWINKSIMKLIKAKNKLYKKFVSTKSEADSKAFKSLSNQLKYTIAKSKQEYYGKTIKNSANRIYIGSTGDHFKSRYNNHMYTFRHQQARHSTELSKYIWDLKEKNLTYNIKWDTIHWIKSNNINYKFCSICNLEKLEIALANKNEILNRRTELMSKCKHHRSQYFS